MSRATTFLDDRLYDYLLAHSVREPALLQALREETTALGNAANMQICPEQGQLLSLLVKITGAAQIVEVGTFTGYSSLCFALALPPNGHITCCDVNEEWTAMAQRYWQQAGVAEKITLRLAPAVETLDTLLANGNANSFDIAFIDADKANYVNYYERALKLIKPNGLILVDNVLWDGDVANPQVADASTEAIRALNRHISQDTRVEVSILPIGDGLTLCRKQ